MDVIYIQNWLTSLTSCDYYKTHFVDKCAKLNEKINK